VGRGDNGEDFFQKIGIIKNSLNPLFNISFWNKKIDLICSLIFYLLQKNNPSNPFFPLAGRGDDGDNFFSK